MANQLEFTTRQKLNLLVIWMALSSSCFVYPILLEGGLPLKFNDQGIQLQFAVFMSFGSWSIATLIRWIVIPKLSRYSTLLGFFIAGLAFTEASIIYGIFLLTEDYPNEKALIFWITILCMVQFFPLLLNQGKPPPTIKQFN